MHPMERKAGNETASVTYRSLMPCVEGSGGLRRDSRRNRNSIPRHCNYLAPQPALALQSPPHLVVLQDAGELQRAQRTLYGQHAYEAEHRHPLTW